ncbi:hypothetical protein CTAYLR_006394 [Chrysophaeum taylorii]|uniref:Ammonium transporter AmtB-like domain-containing protein n=1 Tax=Chrysophaeum taylorii TaxID=2483200 RepID=A0AAD7XIB8_9STRA|nr:hypothetical protein CTAYLR_006394 [Chrysophaeum taylorii]
MVVGFGYLMTFLRWYGLGSAGLSFFATRLRVEVALLAEPLFEHWYEKRAEIDYRALLNANFCVAAILISFGGLIGKRVALGKWLDVRDAGGTISIHMFGAYFGLSASRILGKPVDVRLEKKSSRASDVISLIGTVFLWLYWPSFVSGGLTPGTFEAQRAITNTIIALLGRGKLSPVHVQNSTLAGGVAIGATANFPLGPFGALVVGSMAGASSARGFAKVTPALDAIVHDSCGVGNLHGTPSLLGGAVSAIVPIWIDGAGAPKTQLAGIALTLVISIASGSFTGSLMSLFAEPDVPTADDSPYWEVADDLG